MLEIFIGSMIILFIGLFIEMQFVIAYNYYNIPVDATIKERWRIFKRIDLRDPVSILVRIFWFPVWVLIQVLLYIHNQFR